MEIRTLRYFLAVAKEENITRAAESLFLSQPTLSRQLRELEEEFGKTLFIRGKRKITLTQEGILLRNRAREILDMVDKTEEDMKGTPSELTGTIHFGAGETDGIRYITGIALDLQKEYPGIRYNLFSGDRENVLDHLDKGLIDFGLVFGDYDYNRYSILELPYEDTWCVLMRPDAPLAEKAFITPKDLWDKPLLLSRQSSTDGSISTWLGRELDELNVVCQYNLILNASKMVEEGLGYALALDHLLPAGGSSGLVARPVRPVLRYRLKLIHKRHQVLTPAAALFLERLSQRIETDPEAGGATC